MGGFLGGLADRIQASAAGRFYAKFSADQAMNGAVQIAWQAMFSSFPLVLGLLGLFGLVWRDPEQRRWLADLAASQFPSQLGDLLAFLEETRELSGLLGLASVVGLAWSGYWLFETMALVFNHFYGAPPRSVHRQMGVAAAMMAVYLTLVTVSVAASFASTYVVAASDRALPFDAPVVDPLLGRLASLGSAVAMFLALYRVVPNTPLSVFDVWPGALVAGILFVLLSQAFPLYLRILGGSYAVFQTLGLFLFLMTWFYCLAIILVVGAELNAYRGGHGGAAGTELAAVQALLAAPAVVARQPHQCGLRPRRCSRRPLDAPSARRRTARSRWRRSPTG